MEFDGGGDRGLDILASNSPYSRQVDCDTLRTETPGAEFITPRPLPVPAETPGNSRSPSTRARAATRSRGRRSSRGAAPAASSSSRATTAFSTAPSSASRRTRPARSRDASATRTASPSRTPMSRCVGRSSEDDDDANGLYSFEDCRGAPTRHGLGGRLLRRQPRRSICRGRGRSTSPPEKRATRSGTRAASRRRLRAGGDGLPITGTSGWDDRPPVRVHVLRVPPHAGLRLRQRVRRVRGAGDHELLATNAGIPTTGRPNGQIASFWDDLVIDAEASIRADAGQRAEPALRDRVPQRPLLRRHDPARRLQRPLRERRDPDAVPQHRRRRARAGNRRRSGSRTTRARMRSVLVQRGVAREQPTSTSVRYRPPPARRHTRSRATSATRRPAIANATVTIEERRSRRRRPTPTASTRSSGCRRALTAHASASGCTGTQTRELVVSGADDARLHAAAAQRRLRSHLRGWSSVRAGGHVLPITGTSGVGTVNLPFRSRSTASPTRGRTCARTASSSSWGRRRRTARPSTRRSRPRGGPTARSRRSGTTRSSTPGVDPGGRAGSAPNRRFVIEFRNVHISSDTTRRVDFNAVLHENGEILTQYRNIADDGRERGNSATIGIENHTGHGCAAVRVQPDAARPPAVTSVATAAAPPPSHGLGHVRDEENRPIANATVTIEEHADHAATTDASGFYSFPSVPEGTYDATASANGCSSPQTQELVVSGSDDARLHAPDQRRVRLRASSRPCFEQADTVVPLTGDDEVTTIDLRSRSVLRRDLRARTSARTGSSSSWARRPPTARPAMPRSRPRGGPTAPSGSTGTTSKSTPRPRSGPTCGGLRPTGAS